MTDTNETVEQTTEAAAPAAKTNPLERTVQFSVARKDIEANVQARLRKAQKTAKFHGFRPGKAPMSMVASAYGMEAEQGAIEELAIAKLQETMAKSEYRVAGMPQLYPAAQNDANADQITFEAKFEVFPEVEVPELSAVKMTQYECELTDEDVNKTLETMRKQRANYVDVERGCQDNDAVKVDFKGTLDGVAFEGGTATGYKFALGAGRMLPEFEAAIKGMKAGEEKSFQMTFPSDYQAANLAGKEVTFEVKVTEVQEPQLPELNDEFAKSLGITEGGIAKMISDVKDNLGRELKARVNNKTKAGVMDALLGAVDFAVPAALIQEERQRMIEANREMYKSRGINLPDDMIKPEMFVEPATKRVRLALLIQTIVAKEAITASEEQIKALAEDIAKSYEDPAEVVSWYLGNEQNRNELAAVVIENNVVAWALEHAATTKQSLKFDELMGQAQA